MALPLLEVRNLTTKFETDRGVARAVDDVSFTVDDGTTVALVGESGSGKSVTALSILRLIASPPGTIERGEVLFRGVDLLKLPEKQMRSVRGAGISIVFQEPMTALNPVYRVGNQVAEAIRLHERVSRGDAKRRAVELLDLVGIPSPGERAAAFPHELSGGLRQRVMIAMALACKPGLLIADEPTTALDASVQAQVLELLKKLQQDLGMSILFITHDLGIVAEFAASVVVMYAGRIIESGPVGETFRHPLHPYTRALLSSVPPVDSSLRPDRPRRLSAIEGVVPDLATLGPGCRFAERCALRRSAPEAHPLCESEPDLRPFEENRRAARCHYAELPG
jgi:oligopeptide/dipeptide ABC transporter ATP-binding protein